MTVLRVQRIQAGKSNQPEDATVNTLYFLTADAAPATCTAICSKIDAFFNTAVGAGQAVRYYQGELSMATDPNSYKVFDMDQPTPRVPVATPGAQQQTPIISTQNLPSEVAVCLSFRGSLISGAAAGRRRGRIYIGPLNINALFLDPVTGQSVPHAGLRTALTAAANRLHDDLLALGHIWVVYSPTARGAGSALDATTVITYAWCDNAFDTQRRRGQRPSARDFSNV